MRRQDTELFFQELDNDVQALLDPNFLSTFFSTFFSTLDHAFLVPGYVHGLHLLILLGRCQLLEFALLLRFQTQVSLYTLSQKEATLVVERSVGDLAQGLGTQPGGAVSGDAH